jgi:hypothetical protein
MVLTKRPTQLPPGPVTRKPQPPRSTLPAVLAISHETGVTLAEVAFLLVLIAGVWLVAAELLQPEKWRTIRTVVAGTALASAGVLLIIATHWGHFG